MVFVFTGAHAMQLALTAKQFKVDQAGLGKCLCFKNIGGGKKSDIFVNYSCQ